MEQSQGKFRNGLQKLSDILDWNKIPCKWLNIISAVIFFAMVLLTFIDVFLRYFFKAPLSGIKEYSEMLLVLLLAFSVAYTYDSGSHIHVDLIIGALKGKLKAAWTMVTTFLCSGLVILISYQLVKQSQYFLKSGKIHGTVVHIAASPFQIALTIGFIILALLLIRDCLRSVVAGIDEGLKGWQWAISFGVIVAILVMSYFWVQPDLWNISKPTLSLISIIVMLILMFSGMPTGFALMLTGLLMVGHLRGFSRGLDNIATNLFTSTCDYSWAVVAFFILMGYFCLYAKFGEGIFKTVQAFLGRMRGGLAIVTIGASTMMAGIVGDSMSVASTMSSVALPEMRRYKYDDKLAIGTIAAGSTIGPLIPPSTTFIIYASLTGQSVAKLFAAGIIPGLILAFAFIITIRIICRINPSAGPSGPKSTTKEKLSSLKEGGPIILLFILVIGGIYAGIFTAAEGGAIGCIGSVVFGLIMRRFNIKNFSDALLEGMSCFGMIFLVIVGANVFSTVLAWCDLATTVESFFNLLTCSPKMIAFIAILCFFIAGFFIDIMPLILIGIPIIHPIVAALGVDPIWFTVLVVMSIQSGVITPPFATILFGLRGLNPDIKIGTIFRGVIPFVIATLISIIFLFFVEPLVTWLPYL